MRSAAMRRSAAFLFVAVRCSRVPVFVPLSSFDQIAIEGPSVGPRPAGHLGIGNGSETL